ncbi:unnamed protein product [Psylliodes chrysocephalus]|uniref:Cyclic nucleotide-binding domain-containing protein n=1 Tax=Psylliodes chrysocephalus TaxID=3402493 RepID=A0A9P0GJI9_9CUCU|nr:unnamed protein product [Psylliodes chrysocephala]
MRHHKVPGGMKRRVLRWYDYSWSRGRIQGGGDINTALGLLPDKLKTELALHVNLTVLKKVTIFQECQPEFLRDLVLKMKAYIFTPGDSICRKGEVAREMFIIADGILEVISEHGKVLTTMKAGDFFGEIGILNLDGLNKRTADVRSVGYSELFSLSREDVLNAMKDYPEAQEILQALGRKRLMEVKASARQPPHKEHHHGHGHGTEKGLVDKIKSEAKGLRNALKKSKTHRRSEESLELQPLHPPNHNNKATLKRMSRVKSHDLSQEEGERRETSACEPVISPIGAGLPLLQRLKLLKEKQDNEERGKRVSSPTMLSPTSSMLRSPPPISDETIGAGLPLLQRILMLKAKEDKAKAGAKPVTSSTKSVTGQLFSGMSLGKAPSQNQQMTPLLNALTGRTSISGPTKGPLSIVTSKAAAPVKLLNNKISFRDRIKLATGAKEKDPSIKETLLKDSDLSSIIDTTLVRLVPQQPSNDNNQQTVDATKITITTSTTTATQTINSNVIPSAVENNNNPINGSDTANNKTCSELEKIDSNDKNEAHWSKLKKAAISKDVESSSPLTASKDASPDDCASTDDVEITTTAVTTEKPKPKPNLFLSRRTKHYRSIDDLSPEYGPLPFVKKLKILNERQKLEELELVMKTRSFSLDIPDNQSIDSDTLTRSHSEGSSMHEQKKSDKNFLTTPLAASPLHSSNESNETLERRNLKSILKKLSEDTKEKEIKEAATMPEKIDSTEFKRLMRAPTIEGYAARHSKLSKSVTFNRDTLQSPPNSATLTGETQQNLFPIVGTPLDNCLDEPEQNNQIEIENQIVPNKANHQVKLHKGSLEDEQQYFADILMAIKQVMSAHLHEIQGKYQQKFEKLEEEVRTKDEIITQLQAHISELEQANEDSFTPSDSLDTVISRERQSWEDPSHDEQEELEELPRPIHAWSSSSSLPPHNVVLDIDSTTDTESNAGETSEPEETEDDDGEYENSSKNWEIELLAAQMRERRSASLDQTSGRPFLKKRFVKGSSMDHD